MIKLRTLIILILTLVALWFIWQKSLPVRAQADVDQKKVQGFSVTDSPFV